MVTCCANPACCNEFRLLNTGDLYAVDKPHAKSEYLRICSNCATHFTPHLDPMGMVSLRLRGEREPAQLPRVHATLRLVAHAVRRMPWRRAIPASARPVTESPLRWGSYTHGAHL